jgi:hypothetical protein
VKTPAGYWISGGLIAIAITGAILWVAMSISDMTDTVDGFTRVASDGPQTVRLEAHKYVIYVEGTDPDAAASDVDVTITDVHGIELPTPPYRSELTYAFGGHEGSAQATVRPYAAGEYRVDVSRSFDGESATGVAIGESLSQPLLQTIFGAIAIGALFGLSGIALLATTIVRRHNARKPRVGPAVVIHPPPYGQPSVPPAPYGQRPGASQENPYGRETPDGQDAARDPPPPPYGQTPSPGPPPPPDPPPPPPPLWGPGSS